MNYKLDNIYIYKSNQIKSNQIKSNKNSIQPSRFAASSNFFFSKAVWINFPEVSNLATTISSNPFTGNFKESINCIKQKTISVVYILDF